MRYMVLSFYLLTWICEANGQEIKHDTRSGRLLHQLYHTAKTHSDTNFANRGAMVFLFMNDECPICAFYTGKIRKLDSLCRLSQVPFIMVFSGKYSKRRISLFQRDHDMKMIKILRDKNFMTARLFMATTTPEIVFITYPSGQILYRGLIDDQFAALGEKRLHIHNDYFVSALNQFLKGEKIQVKHTQPIGCFLEYD